MVLDRKTNFSQGKTKKRTSLGIYAAKVQKDVFLGFPPPWKNMVLVWKAKSFPRKSLVFWPKTILLLGKSYSLFSTPKPNFS